MQALVFAAGRGTRLRPHTDVTPKPLLEVGGEPMIARCLRAVVGVVDEIGIVVGYRGTEIVDAIGDTFEGVPITYARQHERMGLAHALVCGAEALGLESRAAETGPLLTVNGDNVFEGDLSALVDAHRPPAVDGAVLLDRLSRNEAETAAVFDLAADGTIQELESTAPTGAETGYLAAGAQIHGLEIVEACRSLEVNDSGEYELADALQSLVDRGRRYVGVEHAGWHLNVNTPADLERARAYFDSEPSS